MKELRFRALIQHKCQHEDCTARWEYYSLYEMPWWVNSDSYDIVVEDLQSTGLKDRAFTEIFEGDIVEIENGKGTNRLVVKRGVVERKMATGWSVDIPCFYFENIKTGFPAFPIVKNWAGKHDLEMMIVVGDIYKNPELL